jgi:nitrogen fixation protein NifB
MDLKNHPCFNKEAHKTFGRVHLPVAPRCNIQCRFCNRKFDCVSESRPGVTSGVLKPEQAMIYLKEVFTARQNISVVGLAGPGDPFANPEETLETLTRVRETYPDMILCVATNGLNLSPYVDDLARLKVSHVTVTVNAVDTKISEKIYSWIRYNKRVMRAEQGVATLLNNQIEGIMGLKKLGLTVKVNTIILPGINEDHIETVAEKMVELKVDILNCVPYYPNEGSAFEKLSEPTPEMVSAIRNKAGQYIKQMRHCTRCRADAVGLLGEKPDAGMMEKLQACEAMGSMGTKAGCDTPGVDFLKIDREEPVALHDEKAEANTSEKPNIAIASMEGVLVNQHLGQAAEILIYGKKDGTISLLDTRQAPPAGLGPERWEQLAKLIGDCGTLLVSGIGETPRRALTDKGIVVYEIEGLIEEAVQAVFEGKPLNHMETHNLKPCSAGCSGDATGCS